MVSRIDVMYRVPAGGQFITSDYDAAGGVDITVSAGLYETLAQLCAEVQTQLQTIDASYTCTESDGEVTIAATAAFTLDWISPSLRDWLGYTGDKIGASSYDGDVQSPGTFIALLPWSHDAPLGWEYRIKRFVGPHQSGGSTLLGSVEVWQVTATVSRGELDQARLVLGHMLRGIPCRLWRDETVATAWSSSNWFGYLDLVLHPDARQYVERWMRDDLAQLASIELRLLEFTA